MTKKINYRWKTEVLSNKSAKGRHKPICYICDKKISENKKVKRTVFRFKTTFYYHLSCYYNRACKDLKKYLKGEYPKAYDSEQEQELMLESQKQDIKILEKYKKELAESLL